MATGLSRTAAVSVLTAATAATALAGCSAPSAPATPIAVEHVHAIAFEDGGSLLIATHGGMVRIAAPTPDAFAAEVSGGEFDAMGMTIADRIYASGHPGVTRPADLENPALGVVASDDGGNTWTSVGLTGTDFHDLTVSSGSSDAPRLYGLDSSGVVRASLDGGVTWIEGATLEARDLVVDTGPAARLWGTTADGLVVSTDDGRSFSIFEGAPRLFLLDRGPEPGTVTGVDVEGVVWSLGIDQTWASGGVVTGPVAAFATGPSGLIAASDSRGISAAPGSLFSPFSSGKPHGTFAPDDRRHRTSQWTLRVVDNGVIARDKGERHALGRRPHGLRPHERIWNDRMVGLRRDVARCAARYRGNRCSDSAVDSSLEHCCAGPTDNTVQQSRNDA